MNKLDVKPEYLAMLVNIFDNYCPNAEIWAYGSRVNGKSHSGSDLDMTVVNFNSPDKKIYELKNLLSESNVPFLMYINLFETLPESFKSEIKKNYVIIYPVKNS